MPKTQRYEENSCCFYTRILRFQSSMEAREPWYFRACDKMIFFLTNTFPHGQSPHNNSGGPTRGEVHTCYTSPVILSPTSINVNSS